MTAGNETGRASGHRQGEAAVTETGDGVVAWMVLRQVGEYGPAWRRYAGGGVPARPSPAPSASAFRRRPTWRRNDSRCPPGKTPGRQTAPPRPSGARTGCWRAGWRRARSRWPGWWETAARARAAPARRRSGAQDRIGRRGGPDRPRECGAVPRRRREFDQAPVRAPNAAGGPAPSRLLARGGSSGPSQREGSGARFTRSTGW